MSQGILLCIIPYALLICQKLIRKCVKPTTSPPPYRMWKKNVNKKLKITPCITPCSKVRIRKLWKSLVCSCEIVDIWGIGGGGGGLLKHRLPVTTQCGTILDKDPLYIYSPMVVSVDVRIFLPRHFYLFYSHNKLLEVELPYHTERCTVKHDIRGYEKCFPKPSPLKLSLNWFQSEIFAKSFLTIDRISKHCLAQYVLTWTECDRNFRYNTT